MFAIVRYKSDTTTLCRYDGTGWRKFAEDNHADSYTHMHIGINRIYTMSRSRRGTAVRAYSSNSSNGRVRTYFYPVYDGSCDLVEINGNPYILEYDTDANSQLHSMDGKTSATFNYMWNDLVSTDTGKCYLSSLWNWDMHLDVNIEGLCVVDNPGAPKAILHANSLWTDGAVYTTMAIATPMRRGTRYGFTRRDPRMPEVENLDTEYGRGNIFGRLPSGLLIVSEYNSQPTVYDVRNCATYYLENFDPRIRKIRAIQ